MKTFDDQDIFPVTTSVDPEGKLSIAGCDLEKTANDFGTPLYLYDGETIRTHIHTLIDTLKKYYPAESAVAYASKAYLSRRFANKLAAENIELDVVSMAELMIAVKAGFSPKQIHFHGNNKTAEEIEKAIDLNIHSLVIDSMDEMLFVENIAAEKNKCIKIWLRITPDIRVKTHPHIETSAAESKFGFHVSTGEAKEGILYAQNSEFFELTGLHCHLGSQLFDPLPYKIAIEMLFSLASECNYSPDEISPGGGWGVRYTQEDPINDPNDWIQTICHSITEQCKKREMKLPKIVIEPGRYIVAQSGVSIYRIGSQKSTLNGIHIIAVDGGMSDNPRMALYQAKYSAKIINKAADSDLVLSRVVGKYCESGDTLIDQINLPKAKRGDLLIIPASGAYQLSMASNYNLAPRPAVLWLETGGQIELLQHRENPEENSWWV
ncbi:MAG: diaminopimelate decarboxylase [Flexilinea sp.]